MCCQAREGVHAAALTTKAEISLPSIPSAKAHCFYLALSDIVR